MEQFHSLVEVNKVPPHINPKTEYYRYGIRISSECNGVLDKSKYTDEQAKMPAVKRIYNLCLLENDNAQSAYS